MTTADNAPDDQQLPEGQAPPSPEPSGPETDADAREREIQRRLTQSGREAAEARRQAAAAQAALASQTQQIGELQASIHLLTANLSERDRQAAEQHQAQIEAELQSLPPADRLERRIGMLQDQVNQLRTAAPQARPAQPTPPAPQPQQPQPVQRAPTDEERAQYMERRVREIIQEANTEFGVAVDLEQIPDGDWESEDTFYRSVMKQAAQASTGGNGVPTKKSAETPAQMRDRIRQEERDRLGVNSPTAPRAAPASARKKVADETEVRAAAQTYDSRLGPKANIAKMKELRATMG